MVKGWGKEVKGGKEVEVLNRTHFHLLCHGVATMGSNRGRGGGPDAKNEALCNGAWWNKGDLFEIP